MPFQPPSPRPPRAVACLLAAAGLALAGAACSHIAPLGPDSTPAAMPAPRRLGSPIIVQVMRSRFPAGTGGCPAGWVAVALPRRAARLPCFRPVGTPVTITSAAVSAVSKSPPPPPGAPRQPVSYGFMVAVPSADVAAVTALIRRAYQAREAIGISVAGRLWEAPRVTGPFPGRSLQIALLSRSQAVRLHRLLVPSG